MGTVLNLFSCHDFCEWCYCEHGHADGFSAHLFIAFGDRLNNGVTESCDSPICKFLKYAWGDEGIVLHFNVSVL